MENLKIAKENVCKSCIDEGSQWVHLRTCQSCGITLCCNSSRIQQMSHHCKRESHSVVISSKPEEKWIYCYIDMLVEYK